MTDIEQLAAAAFTVCRRLPSFDTSQDLEADHTWAGVSAVLIPVTMLPKRMASE